MSRKPERTLFATPPAGTFKAILWKELRENLKWAIAGLLFMSAALVFELHQVLSHLVSGYYSNVEMDALFTATIFGSALIGVLLGLAQSVPENRGDRWGFLAHRPTSRLTLFRGKATAGVILYLMAAGLPIAAAVVWLLRPDHIPMPLDWSIALPCVADLLCGLVYYFAGLLTGMREAKWFGSRVMGVGAGIVCSVFVAAVGRFSVAVAIALAGIIVVSTAARATFVSGGGYETQPRAGRAAVVGSVGCGLLLVSIAAIGTVTSFIEDRAMPPFSGYTFTREGEIVKIVRQGSEILEARSLDGRSLAPHNEQQLTAGVKSAGRLWLGKTPDRPPRYRSTDSSFLNVHTEYGGSRSWYYVYRYGLVAEYSNRSGQLVGWFGPDGFSPGPARPRGFGEAFRPAEAPFETLFTFADAVYRIDVEAQQVQKIFQPRADETVLAAGSTNDDPENFVSVATTRRVIVQSEAGEVFFERPHADLIQKYPVLVTYRALRTADKPFLLWYANGFSPESGSDSDAIKVDAAGRIIEEQKLPAIDEPNEPHWAEMTIALPVVPLVGRTALEIAARFRSYRQREPWEATAALNAASWLVPAAFSAVFAALAYRRGKKYAFAPRRLALWTVLTLLLGPLMFFVMVAAIEWPALERCPSCGRYRIVTNELCEHCHQPFAQPEMDGTEIFEFSEV
jgi:hypothetical protein